MAAWGPLSTVTSTRVPLTNRCAGPSGSRMVPVRTAVVARRQPHLEDGGPEVGLHPRASPRRYPAVVDDASVLAERSASSRYCVVRSTVVPPPTRRSMTSHRSLRLYGSSPVVGSSRNSTVGLGHQARRPGRAGGACRPSRSEGAVGGVGQARTARAARRAARRRARVRWMSRPTIWRFSRPVRVLVDGRDTGRRGRCSRTSLGLLDDVEPRTSPAPSSGQRGRGEDPDRRRLAGAVRPEQPEHGSPRDREIHIRERPELAVALAEAVRLHAEGVLGRGARARIESCHPGNLAPLGDSPGPSAPRGGAQAPSFTGRVFSWLMNRDSAYTGVPSRWMAG